MNARLIHGLLWREWLLHHVWLRWIFAAWLFGVWIFPIHPLAFLLPFGILSALLVAPSFGGSDASEGSEEFSFSLPPTRAQRYLVRLGLGGGILAALLLLGVAAAAFDLPQRVWGLLFESGFTTPFSPTRHPFVYVLAVVLPMAIFSECFAAGASCRRPESMGTVWLRGLFVPGLLLGIAFLAEGWVWKNGLNGYVSCPALALWSLMRLAFGYRDYKRKEGVSGLPATGARRSSSGWLLLLVVLMTLLAVTALFLMSGRSEPQPPPLHVDPPRKGN